MPNFNNGQLNTNIIYNALYNMIISQHVFSDNIKGTYSELVDMARVDGSQYGDTKLYYATDCLESYPWGNDAEAINLLKLHRPNAPEVQKIELNVFRQIRLTLDRYLTKQAWMNSGSFADFTSVMVGWMGETKRIYDATLYNTFIGTTETDVGLQTQTVSLAGDNTDALVVAERLANILVQLRDVTTEFNDYSFTRSYSEDDLIIVWNAAFYNKLKYVDLPTIFHDEKLLDKFSKYVLPEKYFGKVVGTEGTSTTNVSNVSVRSLIETNYTVDSADADPRARYNKETGQYYVHVFAGQLLPDGVVYNQNEAYNEDNSIAFKIIHRRSIPYMSAFQASTEFFNGRSLTDTRFLIFGHNTLEYLKNYPLITVKTTEA